MTFFVCFSLLQKAKLRPRAATRAATIVQNDGLVRRSSTPEEQVRAIYFSPSPTSLLSLLFCQCPCQLLTLLLPASVASKLSTNIHDTPSLWDGFYEECLQLSACQWLEWLA